MMVFAVYCEGTAPPSFRPGNGEVIGHLNAPDGSALMEHVAGVPMLYVPGFGAFGCEDAMQVCSTKEGRDSFGLWFRPAS